MTAGSRRAMPRAGRFLTGSTMGHVARMTMAGATGITFVFLVDAASLFWISRLGDPRLVAAIGYAFAIQFFSVSAGIGLMVAATALVSRSIGAGRRGRARRQGTGAAITAFVIQSAVAAIIFLARHQIVAASGATGETAVLAARYLAISVPSLGLMAVAMISSGILRAEGDGARSMLVTLSSGAFAMVLDPILILGLGLGLDGAALGLFASRCVMLVVALRFVIGTHDLLARPRIVHLKVTLRPYMAIAVPAIAAQMATPLGNFLLTTVMSQYGDEAMAGWAVAGRLTVVAFGGIFSLSGAIGGIFGQNYGAGHFQRLRTTYRDAMLFGLIYTLATWALLVLAYNAVIAGFGLAPGGAVVVRAFAHVGAGGFIFATALFVSNAAFNALGRPGRSTVLIWLRDGVISLPLALLMVRYSGAAGVIYAQAIASLVAGSLAAFWGWAHVVGLGRSDSALPDVAPARPHAHADRFRRQ